jgi:spore germination protein GerM
MTRALVLRSGATRRLVEVTLAIAVLAAGCGIDTDPRPRDVPVEQRRTLDDRPTSGGTEVGTRNAKVYFLAAPSPGAPDRLQPSNRSVDGPEAIMNELLRGLADSDRDKKLRTAIPPETVLRKASLGGDGTAIVDVDAAFFNVSGEQQARAVAQIVFTLTALPDVRSVRLLVDSEQREWPRGDGSLQSGNLSRADFAELNPTSQPDYLPIPSPSAA